MIFGELQFIQIGRLADRPTFKANSNGSKVANARVITNVGWRDKSSNELKERAEGFMYELWGDYAERFAELPKGTEVYVKAEPYNDSYVVEGGETRYVTRFRILSWRAFNQKSGDGKPAEGTGEADF